MLSSMETPLGLVVIGPAGEQLRVLRNSPAFPVARNMLKLEQPGLQTWAELKSFLAKPLEPLIRWCEQFRLQLVDEGDFIRLGDAKLRASCWLPLLQRLHTVSGDPTLALLLIEALGNDAEEANVKDCCLHINERADSGKSVGLVRKVLLPPEQSLGTVVTSAKTGDTPYLVSFMDFTVTTAKNILGLTGTVIGAYSESSYMDDILAQPAILGYNRTYRCEEGSEEGWLEDMSFDSLKAARLNAKDIQRFGSEVRIINRLSGAYVPLS